MENRVIFWQKKLMELRSSSSAELLLGQGRQVKWHELTIINAIHFTGCSSQSPRPSFWFFWGSDFETSMGTCGWVMCGACGWVVCDASGCVNRDLVLGYVFIEVTLVKVARSLCKPIPVEMERVQMNNTTSGIYGHIPDLFPQCGMGSGHTRQDST